MNDYIQYDTSEQTVGDVNIAKAIQTDKKLVFNESYTMMGSIVTTPSIYACYDLTVFADLDVDNIEVRGNLYVIGNIKTKKLSCLKSIICSGDIDAEKINCYEIVANDIACPSISCTGNIVVRTTIDVGQSLHSDKSILAGEGIIGTGRFTARNAIAVEYFDFEGRVLGKVIEMDTDTTYGEMYSATERDESFEEISLLLKKKISEELKKVGEIDEDHLIKFVKKISEIDNNLLSDWEEITKALVELSYKDKITNLYDYLIINMAEKFLPEQIIGYETIEHVFNNMLKEAEKELDALSFHTTNIKEFAYALKVITLCGNELRISQDEALDRIFQSIGIKYKTVKSFLK